MTIDGERALILYDFLRCCIEEPVAKQMRFYELHKHDIDSIVEELEKET